MSDFAKRHYEAIATVMQDIDPSRFKSTDHPERRIQHTETVRALANMLAANNGLFKRDRFVRACVSSAILKQRDARSGGSGRLRVRLAGGGVTRSPLGSSDQWN
jgi:hypothetical protein